MFENRSCMFLLLSAVAGFLSVSGAGNNVKYACPGDSVQAFENIEFNQCNAKVTLHINGERNIDIAVWSIQNCIRNESLLHEYQGRLIFDQNGAITIKNFDHFDQATYVVFSDMDSLPKVYEVYLSLMVAPTQACKPMIEQLENILIASVKAKDCGIPVAVPYWKDNEGVSNTNEPILKLIPEAEAKEYIACIKGAAIKCVKNVTSHEYCTTFKPEGSKSPPARLDTCNPSALIATCIILGIFVILVVLASAVIYIRYRSRRKNVNDDRTTMLLETPKPWTNDFENVNDDRTTMLLETPKPWTNDFGKLNWEEIRQLLNDDQQMGLKTYCEHLSSQNHNLRREKQRQGENVNDEQTTMLLENPKPRPNEFGKLNWEEIRKLQNDDQQMGLQAYCENVNDEQTTMLLETPKPWSNEFGKLNWEEIRKLLNDDQQMGLQAYCDNMISENDNKRREKERQGDVENEKEEASTDQRNCNDPDKIRELSELRDAVRCKICLSNKMSLVFLPCKHIATCSKCSSSLTQCPVCRAVIDDKLTICFDLF